MEHKPADRGRKPGRSMVDRRTFHTQGGTFLPRSVGFAPYARAALRLLLAVLVLSFVSPVPAAAEKRKKARASRVSKAKTKDTKPNIHPRREPPPAKKRQDPPPKRKFKPPDDGRGKRPIRPERRKEPREPEPPPRRQPRPKPPPDGGFHPYPLPWPPIVTIEYFYYDYYDDYPDERYVTFEETTFLLNTLAISANAIAVFAGKRRPAIAAAGITLGATSLLLALRGDAEHPGAGIIFGTASIVVAMLNLSGVNEPNVFADDPLAHGLHAAPARAAPSGLHVSWTF